MTSAVWRSVSSRTRSETEPIQEPSDARRRPHRRTIELNERRWAILAVLCTSLMIVIIGNTALNVAIPTLARDLDASTTDLQWMVDSYGLVFAGLLLHRRHHRRPVRPQGRPPGRARPVPRRHGWWRRLGDHARRW